MYFQQLLLPTRGEGGAVTFYFEEVFLFFDDKSVIGYITYLMINLVLVS